ncbi:MAG TPA: DUF4129 domain-containing protein [Solirubrobacteraceae bacterium]|nr:DUF4129 domain-containing protein [Solirubrobacteraceae bacterium]
MTRGGRAVAAAVAALLWLAAPAAASEVTAGELRALAERARSDPAALAELRAVDRVDGAPVDLRAALAGASPAQAGARAQALAAGLGPAPAPDAARARERARGVLAEKRFRETSLPRPFRRPLRWIGERLRPVARAVDDAVSALGSVVPGGKLVAWLLVAAALAAAVTLLLRRRAAAPPRERAAAAALGHDPRALEAAAADAERAGDWEAAVRLRFRAGLLRLAERELVDDPAARTTGELVALLRSPRFEALGTRFDAIAYGGEPAAAADAAQAREEWPRVLTEARR